MRKSKATIWCSKHSWFLAALLLSILLAIANRRLLAGKSFEHWDAFDFFSPYYSLVADCTRAGHLLLWNPWTNGGSPDFAEPQVGAFSPVLLLFSLVFGGSSAAFRVYWFTLWLTGGIGMLLLARHLRAPVWGGLCVALGFVFCGFYTGHAEHTSVIYSYSFLPFIFWRLDLALERQSFFTAAQSGAFWGLSALGGNPAVTISSCGLIVAWVVGRTCFGGEKSRRRISRGFGILLVVTVVGVVVLAPSYFSFIYESNGYSDRSEPLPRSVALGSNALHPGALVTLLSPAFMPLRFSNPQLWSYTDISSLNLYLGAVVLLLALLGVVGGKENQWRRFLAAIAVGALACALSRVLPFRGWLYDLLPPTRYFRHSSMLRGFFIFLVCVLAILGTRDFAALAKNRILRRRFFFFVALLFAAAVVSFCIFARFFHEEPPLRLLAQFHLSVVWGGLLALGWAVYRAPDRISRWLPEALLAVAIADGLITCSLSEGTLYGPGPSPDSVISHQRSIVFDPANAGRFFVFARGDLNLLPKIATLKGYAPFKNSFHEATAGDPALASIALGKDRFWFSAAAPLLDLNRETFLRYDARMREVGSPILIRHAREALLHSVGSLGLGSQTVQTAAVATKVTPRILDYSADHLTLEVAVPENGWLMVTDRWSRSWQCTVNSKRTAVEGANFIYRAVAVRTGNNRIEFSFRPPAVRALASVSWSTLGGIGLLSCFGSRFRKTTRPLHGTGTNPACLTLTENGLEPVNASVVGAASSQLQRASAVATVADTRS
jgi:hypothetical protein